MAGTADRARASWLTRDRLAGFVLVAVAAAIAWETRSLPLGSLHEPGPGYLPLITAVLMGGFGVLVALRGGGPALGAMKWPEARHALALLGACAFAAFALERLGYRLTTLALLVFFLGVIERRRPLAIAVVALGLSLGTFYIFADLLRVPLPRGPWGF